jgi:hypothetical protein
MLFLSFAGLISSIPTGFLLSFKAFKMHENNGNLPHRATGSPIHTVTKSAFHISVKQTNISAAFTV